MRVRSVPERHPLDSHAALGLPSQAGVLLPEVVADRAVVLGRHLKRLEGEPPPRLVRDLARGLPLVEDNGVVGRGGEDGDPTVVLRGGAEEGDASDVDLLDGSREGAVRGGDGEDERVEVAGDDGDGRDRVGGQVREVRRDVAREDACSARRQRRGRISERMIQLKSSVGCEDAPPWTAGCRVLTRPPSISGALVMEETSLVRVQRSKPSQPELVWIQASGKKKKTRKEREGAGTNSMGMPASLIILAVPPDPRRRKPRS